jgi:hypothetical protein
VSLCLLLVTFLHSRFISASFGISAKRDINSLSCRLLQPESIEFHCFCFIKHWLSPSCCIGAENRILTVPQKKRIEAAKMKLLRPLAGYTLRGHKYNDDIRSELGVQSITEILDIYRTNWNDHLLRMEPYRVPLQVYRYRPTGRRNVGRPRKRWKEQF